jgi:hypothetical protein
MLRMVSPEFTYRDLVFVLKMHDIFAVDTKP